MNIQNILKKIAMQNGVSVDQVRQDIQEALDYGWNSTDKNVQAYWRKIPAKHGKPTLDKVLLYIINSIR